VAQEPLVDWLILGQVAAVPNVWSQEHLSFPSWHCGQFFSGAWDSRATVFCRAEEVEGWEGLDADPVGGINSGNDAGCWSLAATECPPESVTLLLPELFLASESTTSRCPSHKPTHTHTRQCKQFFTFSSALFWIKNSDEC